jgi:hypothetical protein
MSAEQRAGESVEQLEHRYREMRWRQRPDITEAFTPAQAEPNESRLHIRNAERDQAEAARRPKPTVHEVDWELMRKECELRLRLSKQRGRNRAKRRQEGMIRHIRANESRDKAT